MVVYPKTFVELQSEDEIKFYLRRNGPVLVSVFLDVERGIQRDGIVSLPRGTTSGSTEWDYVNHSIVLTGWGRDEQNRKFWTAYNTWGYNMRIERGGESAWIHKHALAVIPDLCRGKLRRIFGCQETSILI